MNRINEAQALCFTGISNVGTGCTVGTLAP